MSTLDDTIVRLEQVQARLQTHLSPQRRDWLTSLKLDGRSLVLTGPRGTGKTTWLLSQLEHSHHLYLSADHPLVSPLPLYDLIETAFMRGYEGVLLDEIHYAADWATHLKAAYDSFPGKVIVASGSSPANLRSGSADLSRRFPVCNMPLLSFREYLMLVLGVELPKIDPYGLSNTVVGKLVKEINVLRYFEEYLQGGFRPFFLESRTDYSARLLNTVTKSIESDVPFLVPSLSDNHLRLMNAVIGYLATSPIPVLRVNSLCSEWSLSKDKLYQLLYAMERVHLIRIVRRRKDTKMQSVGAKILLCDPSLYTLFGENRGTLREAYVAMASAESGRRVYAADREQECDFIVDDATLEVGGSTKHRKAADYVVRDNLDVPSANTLPMWLLGFEY